MPRFVTLGRVVVCVGQLVVVCELPMSLFTAMGGAREVGESGCWSTNED